MSLGIRKIIVLSLIGLVFLSDNILVVANWIAESRVEQKANWLREEFLTGTAIAVTDYYSYCTSLLNCSEFSLKHVLNL